jgi:hypothetical protein
MMVMRYLYAEGPDLDHARAAIAEGLRELMDAALGSDQPETIARALATCRDFRQDAATIADDVEAHLLASMGERTLEVVGLGEFKVRRRTTRKAWDHDALLRDAVRGMPGTEMGNAVGPPDPADVIARVRAVVSLGSGKVGGIRELGLQVDAYCQETEAGWQLELPPRQHYVGHAAVTDRLLQADAGWTWEPLAFDADGAPLIQFRNGEATMWIRLTVDGVSRLGVGSAQEGSFELHKQLISDALRNAAMRFGVALDLWSKEGLADHSEPDPEPQGDWWTQNGWADEADHDSAREQCAARAKALPEPKVHKAWLTDQGWKLPYTRGQMDAWADELDRLSVADPLACPHCQETPCVCDPRDLADAEASDPLPMG